MKQALLQIKSGKQEIYLRESTNFIGLWIGTKDDLIQAEIEFIIEAPNLSCLVDLKLILLDQAKITLHPNFRISKKAKETDNYLKVAVLTCSAESKAEVIPGLEINTNNLKAGHSLSISYLDPEELFYLQAKGMTKVEAEQILISAFANQIMELANVKNKSILLAEYAKLENK